MRMTTGVRITGAPGVALQNSLSSERGLLQRERREG